MAEKQEELGSLNDYFDVKLDVANYGDKTKAYVCVGVKKLEFEGQNKPTLKLELEHLPYRYVFLLNKANLEAIRKLRPEFNKPLDLIGKLYYFDKYKATIKGKVEDKLIIDKIE